MRLTDYGYMTVIYYIDLSKPQRLSESDLCLTVYKNLTEEEVLSLIEPIGLPVLYKITKHRQLTKFKEFKLDFNEDIPKLVK